MNKFLTIIFLAITGSGYAQKTYTVAAINGKIRDMRTKHLWKTGDEVTLKDSIEFGSPHATATLMDEAGNLRVIPDKNTVPTKTGQGFVALLSEIYVPEVHTRVLATRAGIMNSLADLQAWIALFSDASAPLAVIGYDRVPLNPGAFPGRTDKFFLIRYNWEGQVINKKIAFAEEPGGRLFLSIDSSLYKVDGKPIDPGSIDQMELIYYDQARSETRSQGFFYSRYTSETGLFSKWCLLQKRLSASNAQAKIQDAFQQYVSAAYGQLSQEQFTELLNRYEKGSYCR